MPDQDQINKKEKLEGEEEKESRKEKEKKEKALNLDNFIEQEKSKTAEEAEKPEIKEAELEQEKPQLESIKEKISKQAPKKGTKKQAINEVDVKKRAQEIYDFQDADQQVEKLVQLAVQQDPFSAIKIAQHLDENYVLDKLHDELLEEKIQKILKEKGILK